MPACAHAFRTTLVIIRSPILLCVCLHVRGCGCGCVPVLRSGFIAIYVPSLMDGCDYGRFATCTDQYAPYTVGRVKQWGRSATPNNYGLDIGPWPGVAGLTNTGWHWRANSSAYNINGAPSYFEVGDSFQIQRGHFIVLSVSYPPTTTFTVRLYSRWWSIAYPNLAMSTKATVLTPQENILPANQFVCTGNWYIALHVTAFSFVF
jgi:hypothetical protein